MLGKRTPLKRLKRFTKKASDVPRPTRKRKAHEDLDIDLENEFENAEPPIDLKAGKLASFWVKMEGVKCVPNTDLVFYLQLWRV